MKLMPGLPNQTNSFKTQTCNCFRTYFPSPRYCEQKQIVYLDESNSIFERWKISRLGGVVMIDDVLRERQLGETLVCFKHFCQNDLEIKGSEV